MSSTRIMLNAVGLQDKSLTENPENTHLKATHRPHTNFAKCVYEVYPTSHQSDNVLYNFGELVPFTIEKTGDLLLNVNIQIKLGFPTGNNQWVQQENFVPETMYALIEYIEIASDNVVLQKLTGHWLYIWDQLRDKTEKQNIAEFAYASNHNLTGTNEHTLHLPIPFWFSSNPGLAIPLWAIQHENLTIRLKLRNFNELADLNFGAKQTNFIIKNIKLLCEFVELDSDEKRKFQDTSLEYLIEQVEFNGITQIEKDKSFRKKIEIQKYPLINELIWVFTGSNFHPNPPDFNVYYPGNYFNFWKGFRFELNEDHTKEVAILLNGNPINSRFKGSYYRKVQRFQNHSCSSVYNPELDSNDQINKNSIYMYSFALDPENITPSGSLSTDKFNSVALDMQINSDTISRNLHVYIKRFNIMRIKDGHLSLLSN